MKNLTLLFYFFTVFISLNINSQERKYTKSANVFLLKKSFQIGGLTTTPKKVWIYLPPDYQKTKKRYPVVYMHDGQNLFDNKTSYTSEWKVDETLNDLYKQFGKGFIVVGIENGGAERINEYTPWAHKKYGGGKADLYVNFLVDVLKPYIDSHYRTLPSKENTAIVGSDKSQ